MLCSRMLLRCAGNDRRALPAGGPGRPGRFLLQRRGDDADDDAHVPGFLQGFEDESDDEDEPRVTARCVSKAPVPC